MFISLKSLSEFVIAYLIIYFVVFLFSVTLCQQDHAVYFIHQRVLSINVAYAQDTFIK